MAVLIITPLGKEFVLSSLCEDISARRMRSHKERSQAAMLAACPTAQRLYAQEWRVLMADRAAKMARNEILWKCRAEIEAIISGATADEETTS